MKASDTDIDNIYGLLEKAIALPHDEFLPEFLSAYVFPNATIKKTIGNGPDSNGRYSIRQKLLYMPLAAGSNVEKEYLEALEAATHKERFVVVTDFERFMAKDVVNERGIDIPFDELPENYEFFFPWCGREAVEQLVENPADVKAATQMARLFESIKKDNEDNAELTEEALNVFLTRLLFCLFADDTHIFSEGQFRKALQIHTSEDGSSIKPFLEGLFAVLDKPMDQRGDDVKVYYKDFPYVNGGLFQKHYPVPKFSKASRRKLLECCVSDWSAINPDIFGSMFQTVISEEQRRTLGQHYTSVTNIMKVLNPLFLDDLRSELDEIEALPEGGWKKRKLGEYRQKLASIKVFDPACGSGNFLITAYKELCHLDMKAINLAGELMFVDIRLDHFYGIEIDDFPCEIARLSLWLAQHQINRECFESYGYSNPTLPLTASGHIVCGNALRLDWNEVCSAVADDTVYICGNPPYAGGWMLDDIQRTDKESVLNIVPNNGFQDYISCWFMLGTKYIKSHHNVKLAFVTTNSIVQGMQVTLWPALFSYGVEIAFAYESFKWSNNAIHNAGVVVTIIGLQTKTDNVKYIYSESSRQNVKSIGPYLVPDFMDIVLPRQSPIINIPTMDYGIKFIDGGNLIFSTLEKDCFLEKNPSAAPLFKKLIGSEEFIKGKERWCLWIDDNQVDFAITFTENKKRIENVKLKRLKSNDKSAQKLAEKPWQTREHPDISKSCIIMPRVSSERRDYVPIGYWPADTVINDRCYVIYDAPLWLFSMLVSTMHMVWMRTVCSYRGTSLSYSNLLCYNTFPFLTLSENQKKALEDSALRILEAREMHYTETMAQLYDPDKMPDDLRAAHESNDLLVDSLYRRTGFENDNDRLQELFRRYKEAVR